MVCKVVLTLNQSTKSYGVTIHTKNPFEGPLSLRLGLSCFELYHGNVLGTLYSFFYWLLLRFRRHLCYLYLLELTVSLYKVVHHSQYFLNLRLRS